MGESCFVAVTVCREGNISSSTSSIANLLQQELASSLFLSLPPQPISTNLILQLIWTAWITSLCKFALKQHIKNKHQIQASQLSTIIFCHNVW